MAVLGSSSPNITLGPPNEILSRLGGFAGDNRMAMLGAAAQLLGGQGFSGAGQGMMMGSRLDQGNKVLKEELAAKKKKEAQEAEQRTALEAALGPDAVKRMGLQGATDYYRTLELAKNRPRDPEESWMSETLPDGTRINRSSRGRESLVYRPEGSKPTEFDRLATEAGLEPGSTERQQAARQKLLGAGESNKAPAGYRWAPDGQSLEKIAGGPADQISSETAARVAWMRSARGGFNEAKKHFLGDEKTPNTGIEMDAWGASGRGEGGRARRSLRIAIEGALRAQTGAAAPESEVANYLDMFSPAIGDTAATRQQKLGALENFMNSVESVITQGGIASAAGGGGQQPKPDPLGIR